MKPTKKIFIPFFIAVFTIAFVLNGCGIYKFRDVSIAPEAKTFRVNFIENRAPYVNPRLSPQLTDRIRRKIINQTRLAQTNNDNADFDISATVTDYNVSTAGVANQQTSMNQLTVIIQVQRFDRIANNTEEFTITRNFPFDAKQSLEVFETGNLDQIVSSLSDDIFNRLFSNW